MLKESRTIIQTFAWRQLQFSTQRRACSVLFFLRLCKPLNMNQVVLTNAVWEGELVNSRDFYNMVINYVHFCTGLPYRAWLPWHPELGRMCYDLNCVRSPKTGLIICVVFKINIDVRAQTVVMGWTLLPYFQKRSCVYYSRSKTEQRSNGHWKSWFKIL